LDRGVRPKECRRIRESRRCPPRPTRSLACSASSKVAKPSQFWVSGVTIFTPALVSAGPMLVPTKVASVAVTVASGSFCDETA